MSSHSHKAPMRDWISNSSHAAESLLGVSVEPQGGQIGPCYSSSRRVKKWLIVPGPDFIMPKHSAALNYTNERLRDWMV